MNILFAETLKKLRKEKGLSQIQLGNLMFVNNSTVARWESGRRLPDAAMITRLSKVLDVDVSTLLSTAAESGPHTTLENIRQRLSMMCGGCLIIEPGDGCGTVVTITIPDGCPGIR